MSATKPRESIRDAYLKQKIIAYIGNKRRLLPFIERSIQDLRHDDRSIRTFADLFAGSGSVARLARTLDLEVYANDWEYYAYVLNYAHLFLLPEDVPALFTKVGGLDTALATLNALDDLPEDKGYIATYYAPKDDTNPDLDNERMFYTAENAKIIDKVRETIENWYDARLIAQNEYYYLLAALVYEAGTHANTSGVFKAFHRGFGGKKKDALKRILGRITLTPLPLYPGERGIVTCNDANALVKRHDALDVDIAYLDPPYNQHQYGSNYHMLNTVALWDKPPINKEIYVDGKPCNKSGIRKDWKKTKSLYCYRESAYERFVELLGDIRAKYIVMSYSTDGIIPVEMLIGALERKGKCHLRTEAYTRYRGAKQSIVNKTKNVEYLFIVDTTRKASRTSSAPLKTVLEGQIRLLLDRVYIPENKQRMLFQKGANTLSLDLDCGVHIAEKEKVLNAITGKSVSYLAALKDFLEEHVAGDRYEEMHAYLHALRDALAKGALESIKTITERIPVLYNKFNGKRGSRYFSEVTLALFAWLTDYFARHGRDEAMLSFTEKIISMCESKLRDIALHDKSISLVMHQLHAFKHYVTSPRANGMRMRPRKDAAL